MRMDVRQTSGTVTTRYYLMLTDLEICTMSEYLWPREFVGRDGLPRVSLMVLMDDGDVVEWLADGEVRAR